MIFHARVQGDLGATAAFSTSKKSFASSAPGSSSLIFHCLLRPFEMSDSKQTCNGGQPQRKKSVYGGLTWWQMSVFFALPDQVICVSASTETSRNLEMSGKHDQQE